MASIISHLAMMETMMMGTDVQTLVEWKQAGFAQLPTL